MARTKLAVQLAALMCAEDTSKADSAQVVPVVLKLLLDAGLLHGDVLTVTGKTMAENLAELDPPAPDGAKSMPA